MMPFFVYVLLFGVFADCLLGDQSPFAMNVCTGKSVYLKDRQMVAERNEQAEEVRKPKKSIEK
jgi:hypothetical protein